MRETKTDQSKRDKREKGELKETSGGERER